MAFTSIQFLLFFPLVALVHSLLPHRYRWVFLLIAGLCFYMSWKPEYVAILVLGTIVDHLLALQMQSTISQARRRLQLIIGLVANVGVLFLFKYWNFSNELLLRFLSHFNILYSYRVFQWVKPVGISFYIFKKISYLVDVYRNHLPAERNPGKLLLYVSFFPEIASGPITRAKEFLPQLEHRFPFDYDRVTGGLKLIAWGLFKKAVVADRLAILVDNVFSAPRNYEGITLMMASLFFSVQIYADFSGYSDMAIGVAQILGFRTADNFDRPYQAKSLAEFWRRWHISLSQWLRDYLFLTITYATLRHIKRDKVLGISAESWSYMFGIISTMSLCGLWHGASLHFLVWGGLNGVLLTLSHLTSSIRTSVRRYASRRIGRGVLNWWQTLSTFTTVSILWIFFRASSLSDALFILRNLGSGLGHIVLLQAGPWFHQSVLLGHSTANFMVLLGTVGLLLFMHHYQPHSGIRNMLKGRPWHVRWGIYCLLVVGIALLRPVAEGGRDFIYLQF